MNAYEALRIAFAGLLANRLRSALTMLGILIGVMAVILLVAVGNGASVQINNQIQSLGANVIYVYPANARGAGGVSQGFGTSESLTMSDVDALNKRQQDPDVVAAIPIAQSGGQITWQNQNYFAATTGTTSAFPQVRDYQIAEGSFFTDDDVQSQHRVVVIGQTVVDNLFGNTDPVGQTIKINRQSFRVIGVFAAKGGTGFGSQDNVVVAPITAVWAYLSGARGGKNISQIVASASSAGTVNRAETEITTILLQRHQVSDPSQADFQILSQQDILKQANSIATALTLVLGAIAGISLVVGGIGIMNIMLVTVTERTREIGIRKAIGARWRDVLTQFLIEAMVLSGLGGALGIALGAVLAYEAPHIPAIANSGFPAPVVSVPSVLMAFGVSVGIGLFFGIYPANRAARLHPIEALRHE
ncbi:MAG TPA: ABC transporter permease [Candidatus Dormibacteraeota bacterium]|nr:ABC transporter permease [Candidatus Dormibacteraeota bacterium]